MSAQPAASSGATCATRRQACASSVKRHRTMLFRHMFFVLCPTTGIIRVVRISWCAVGADTFLRSKRNASIHNTVAERGHALRRCVAPARIHDDRSPTNTYATNTQTSSPLHHHQRQAAATFVVECVRVFVSASCDVTELCKNAGRRRRKSCVCVFVGDGSVQKETASLTQTTA